MLIRDSDNLHMPSARIYGGEVLGFAIALPNLQGYFPAPSLPRFPFPVFPLAPLRHCVKCSSHLPSGQVALDPDLSGDARPTGELFITFHVSRFKNHR